MIIYTLNRIREDEDGFKTTTEILKSTNKESIDKISSMIDDFIYDGWLVIEEINVDEIEDVVSKKRMTEILEEVTEEFEEFADMEDEL